MHASAARRRSWRRARTRFARHSMIDGSPENDEWLRVLVERSPLLPDAALRAHWRRVIPWLPTAARYELAAILTPLDVDRGSPCG